LPKFPLRSTGKPHWKEEEKGTSIGAPGGTIRSWEGADHLINKRKGKMIVSRVHSDGPKLLDGAGEDKGEM